MRCCDQHSPDERFDVHQWANAGFGPMDAVDWAKAGFCPQRAAYWRHRGLSPSKARMIQSEDSDLF